MKKAVLVGLWLVAAATSWGSFLVVTDLQNKLAETKQQLAQCRAAGSATVVAQAAAEWEEALKIAERCTQSLDICRGLYHQELARNGSLKCQVDVMAQSVEDEVVKRIERGCRP